MERSKNSITTIVKPIIVIHDSSSSSTEELAQYKIETAKPNITFPIDLIDTEFRENTEDTKKDLILMLHGTYESKAKIIDDFNAEHPECSKASIERYIKEISSRQRIGDSGKYRYIVDQEVIEQSEVDLEKVNKIWQDRYDVYIEEVRKIEQEKQREIEEKEKQKQIEKQKKNHEKKIEKEKKEAEALKIRQEKERIKLEKKLEQEKLKEQK